MPENQHSKRFHLKMIKTPFLEQLADYRKRVNVALKQAINANSSNAPLLHEAMVYATLNCGKRLRPILVYATAACFGQTHNALDTIAAAIECIHSYSLIHDDLPAMDDDNLRRGKPTCHIVFGEATAILAGDALQTLAFDLLATLKHEALSPSIQLQLIRTLAMHSGSSGMIAGQSLDLLAEGKKLTPTELEQIHHLKTGALIRANVIMGALGAGCSDENTLAILDRFANRLGLAFQLQDDLLDITGNSKKLGKMIGQDVKHQKATHAILFGSDNTQTHIKILMNEAITLLQSLTLKTTLLKALCDYLIHRDQ